MLISLLLLHTAHACETVTPEQVAVVASPSIVVLGERHGATHDLRYAASIVERLATQGPVTVALEAVAERHQGVLDRLQRGEIRPRRVKRETDWSNTWGFRFSAYRPLLAVPEVRFVAAGPPLRKKPEDVEVPIPESYPDKFVDMAVAHGMRAEDAPAFAASMAYRDRRIAALSVEGWDGTGVLVIVTGRGHVAEGLGTPWQLTKGLTEAPITTALLAPGDDCGPEDRSLPPR